MNKIRIPKSKIKKNTCNTLIVPQEVCYIRFKDKREKYSHSIDHIKQSKKTIDLFTDRGEMLILDMNNKDKIIGIELVDINETKRPHMKTKQQ